jgi:hypothetical protein
MTIRISPISKQLECSIGDRLDGRNSSLALISKLSIGEGHYKAKQMRYLGVRISRPVLANQLSIIKNKLF